MENTKSTAALLSCFLLAIWFAAPPALGHDDDDRRLRARLDGFSETLVAVSTPAKGRFSGTIDRRRQSIDYVLSYEGLASGVQQAHIHFGQRFQSGGISVFLCTNLGKQAQACPSPSGTVRGTITAADVIGPAAQGIAAGEFGELLEAIEEGVTYVNVHSKDFPGGEIRGQIR